MQSSNKLLKESMIEVVTDFNIEVVKNFLCVSHADARSKVGLG